MMIIPKQCMELVCNPINLYRLRKQVGKVFTMKLVLLKVYQLNAIQLVLLNMYFGIIEALVLCK